MTWWPALIAAISILGRHSALSYSVGSDGHQRECIADFYFLIDSSASTGPARFHRLRHFVSDIAHEMWRAGYYSARIGTIRFGGSQGAEITLPLTSIDQRKLINAGLARTFYTGGRSTRLEKAFHVYSEEGQHFSKGNRDLIRDVLFVITDDPYPDDSDDIVTSPTGEHFTKRIEYESHNKVIRVAQKLKQNGVGIIVLAVSDLHQSSNSSDTATNSSSTIGLPIFLPPAESLYNLHQNDDMKEMDKQERLLQQVQQDAIISRNLKIQWEKVRDKKREHLQNHPYEQVASTPHYFWRLSMVDKLQAFLDTAVLQLCQMADFEDASNATYLPSFQTWQHSYNQMLQLSALEKQQAGIHKKKVSKHQKYAQLKSKQTKMTKPPKKRKKIVLLIPPLVYGNGRFFTIYHTNYTKSLAGHKSHTENVFFRPNIKISVKQQIVGDDKRLVKAEMRYEKAKHKVNKPEPVPVQRFDVISNTSASSSSSSSSSSFTSFSSSVSTARNRSKATSEPPANTTTETTSSPAVTNSTSITPTTPVLQDSEVFLNESSHESSADPNDSLLNFSSTAFDFLNSTKPFDESNSSTYTTGFTKAISPKGLREMPSALESRMRILLFDAASLVAEKKKRKTIDYDDDFLVTAMLDNV